MKKTIHNAVFIAKKVIEIAPYTDGTVEVILNELDTDTLIDIINDDFTTSEKVKILTDSMDLKDLLIALDIDEVASLVDCYRQNAVAGAW